jgi:adenine-specific DNA-methyltransferase
MPTLHWVGKDKVINHHHDVPFRLLDKKYSFEAKADSPANSSGNRIIHGDNLEALKSLLPEFEGKVNCIYIDPPYNTGNEGWVYNDSVNDPKIKKWLGEVVGKEGEDLSRHDKWLCMMYPRLKLLHRLLSNSGAIFISIDENEITSLRAMLNEIFGEANYVATITVVVKPEGRRYGFFAKTHEYILVFCKKYEEISLNDIEVEGTQYNYSDLVGGFNLKGLRNRNVRAFNSSNRPNLRYSFYVNIHEQDQNGLCPVSVDPIDNWVEVVASTVDGLESVWRWGKDRSRLKINELVATVGSDSLIRIFQKERKLTQTAKTTWDSKYFHSIRGTKELADIFERAVFDFPKPVHLIYQILSIGTNENDLVLDTFSGSGTTAHAVLKLNAQDGGNRKFILIETMDYAETITAERVRRVMDGYGEGTKAVAGTGGSFDFYTVGQPLFLEDNNLNESVGSQAIREYVAYTEGIPLAVPTSADYKISPYMLGRNGDSVWLFYYDPSKATTLSTEFLAELNIKAASKRPVNFIVYADKCSLDEKFMRKHGITFKRIPRDITKF